MIPIKLTKEQQQLSAAIFMIVVFGFIYIKFFWLPLARQSFSVKTKINEISSKIDAAKVQAGRLPRLDVELAALNQQAIEAEKRLPKTKSVPDILVTVGILAEQYGVLLQSFSLGSPSSKQYFIELDYPLVIKGTFHNVGRFLAALALTERIFNVQNVAYSEAGPDGVMTVNVTLVSYQYKG